MPETPIDRRDPDHRDLLRLAIEAAGAAHNLAAMDKDALSAAAYAEAAADYAESAAARLRELAVELRERPSA